MDTLDINKPLSAIATNLDTIERITGATTGPKDAKVPPTNSNISLKYKLWHQNLYQDIQSNQLPLLHRISSQ